jgi:shikimate dehydrogenase
MPVYGLIGGRLGHSLSAVIHSRFGNPHYTLFPLDTAAFHAFMAARAFDGVNVTIPYKRDVLPYCDWQSVTVRRIGSANTLIMADGRLCAHNTDLYGMLAMIDRSGIRVPGAKALILGSGGTGLTARAALADRGAQQILTVSRSGPVTYISAVRDHGDTDIIINTTPVGMWPDTEGLPLSLQEFPALAGVLDVVYRPSETRLIREAAARGIPRAGGLWMLVSQARRAHELFTGQIVPDSLAEDVYNELVSKEGNL